VSVSSSEGSVEYVAFDNATVFERVTGVALNMATATDKAAELLKNGVNRARP